ncbi:Phage protein [Heyndrickxia coagulans]|uniref:Uncharacterized protein n=2 Tax=Heyndrickxia TaxID=2837504 RepID=A0AAN0WDY5_HEYCO|nr:hypothetical protein SB48_HM08orf06329 [Heyndrickxia coagulans]AKN53763.1 Phage protein [Heyndrickxia coagulans]
MSISRSTLNEWKKKYPDISDALKKGKEVVDLQVENALLKRALGYEYTEKKYETVEMSEEEYYACQKAAVSRFKLEHPEATFEEIQAVELGVPRYKPVLTEEKTKEVAPDVTAQIFWLKNRRPDKWRDKQDIEHSGSIKNEIDMSGLSLEELRRLAKDDHS